MFDVFQTLLENVYFDFLFDFLLNIVTVTFLCFFIYYRRHHNKEAFTAYMLFNVFVFIVITVLFHTEDGVSLGLGFGLFAILSIITLRSEVLAKTEITYFFGTLSIAIINAIGLTDYLFVILCNVIIIIGAWVIDNPNILPGILSMKITLDYIPDGVLENSEKMKKLLNQKFNINIISYSVNSIDYVKDTAKLKITYRVRKTE